MRTNHRLPLAALLVLTLVSPAWPAELFRRAESLEERLGRAEIRRAYGARLEVLVDCEAGERGCVEDRVYDEVLSIEFHLTRQEVEGDSIVSIEDPASTIYVATHFAGADREKFRVELERTLRGLSADAFDEPFAGLEPMQAPFDKPTWTGSELPSWTCFESGSDASLTVRYHRRMDGDRVLGIGATRYAKPPTAVCSEIREATEGADPEVFWTLASPKLLREKSVEHNDLLELDPSSLLERPRGIQLVKQPMRKGASLEASSPAVGGGLSRATHGEKGWRFDAWAEPTEIPVSALDENAWLHSWTISTVERTLGAYPAERVLGRTFVFAAYLATVPAAELTETKPDGSYPVTRSGHLDIEVEQPVSRTPPNIDRRKFVDELVSDLERHGGAPEEKLASWLGRPPVGLESEGWLAVVCYTDGTATYFVPPTQASNRVTNAEQFCAALQARLY